MIALDAALEYWLLDRSRANRDRLVAEYHYLCARGARRFLRPGLDRSDLEQVAAIGLLKACDRYDASHATPFEAFAWLFVVGELMHHVRDHERMIRPPRRMRQLDRKWHEIHERLVASLGREPRDSEMAEALQIGARDVVELRTYRERASLADLSSPHVREPQAAPAIDALEDRLLVDEALSRLNAIERTIVLAVYERGYSQVEVAEKLGYSQRHISRLHRAALRKMQPVFV